MRVWTILLGVIALVIWQGHADPAVAGGADPNQAVGVAPPAQQQNAQQPQQTNQNAAASNSDSQRLAQKPECHADIQNFCSKIVAQLPQGEVLSDMAALECLQDAAYNEATNLQPACAQAVWEYKIAITQDLRFIGAIRQFCQPEIEKNPKIKECTLDERPGYGLSCMMDHAHEIEQNSQLRTERVAFSDFRLVAPFVEQCSALISGLGCGALTKPTKHQNVRVPHSQGSTLECLIEKLKYCHDLAAGEGKVFQCLMSHKEDTDMEPECGKILSERAGLMGQDYRLAHPLTKGCANEMQAYKCIPQAGFEKSLNFHLSWVILCLENGLHHFKQTQHEKQQAENDKKPIPEQPNLMPYTEECQHEMMGYREMMVQEFRMSPELVMSCAQEIDKFCSPKGDIETEGKTIHCLMGHAQARDEKKVVGPQCRNALQTLMKVADIGSNYKVDKVLYASCRPLIDGKCSQDAVSEASTLTCLMKNIDGPDMTDECEQRLVEVQYFMARDWSLDPQLYDSCHKEAVQRCSAVDNWHANAQGGQGKDFTVDPGPQVLACLYRAGYDEEHPLSPDCAQNVRRVLRTRANRVNLIPEIEETCRDALSEYCSTNVKPMEEMNCLQSQFETKQFKDKYPRCHDEVQKFTQMESKDTKLNRLLTRACRPVIDTYCVQFANEEIDHGDVMECLATHKDAQEMTPKCRSYVNHFELISLRDYHFSYRFQEACEPDIKQYCSAFGPDKGAIIRCLSNIMFEHRVLGEKKDLRKECKKELRVAYLQQEQVNFDDKSHMGEADPELTKKCGRDLERLKCFEQKSFEDVIECLRVDYDNLEPDCKAMIFQREKIEAIDNTFDDELQKGCKYDIGKFCSSQQGEKVLDCLSNMKIVRLLQKNCQKIVQERMLERVKDDRLNPGLLEACQFEAQEHCREDYNKINDHRYEKQQLGSIIASCLRTKFSQFGGKGIHLNPQCKDEVTKVILESEFDVQLDPALYKACKSTIPKHCSNAIISKSGNFDSVLECLKADFYTNQIQDADCARQLSRRTQESLVDIHLDPSLHEACSMDIQRVCRDTIPGQSRIIMCLMDAAQVPQITLSSACRNKLTERQKLWNMAHDEYKMALPETWHDVYNIVANHPHRTSILTWVGGILLVLLLLGCCCGRWTKRIHSELKNR
ncbi:cysteine rich repeat domain-containing protein [Ditylenchus destructor]|nr:cysteine rich repeat domain-containing protein [Ditylenchus destructor]